MRRCLPRKQGGNHPFLLQDRSSRKRITDLPASSWPDVLLPFATGTAAPAMSGVEVAMQ